MKVQSQIQIQIILRMKLIQFPNQLCTISPFHNQSPLWHFRCLSDIFKAQTDGELLIKASSSGSNGTDKQKSETHTDKEPDKQKTGIDFKFKSTN